MEDAYIIKGGKPLRGQVKLSGAKNVALKVIIASLMFEGKVILKNVPRINDVLELLHLIKILGGRAEFIEENTLQIEGKKLSKNKVDLYHGSKVRVSFMLAAPLLYQFKECFIPNPGGCRIGARPIDRIVEGMRKIGIMVEYDSQTGFYKVSLEKKPGGYYRFPKPSHTGTEFLILLSALSDKKTIIENAAMEPEVDELIRFLNESGGNIYRRQSTIVIEGVSKLKQKKVFNIIADRNEAVTYASLAVASGGEIKIGKIPFPLIATFVKKLETVGGGFIQLGEGEYKFFYQKRLKSSRIETSPHPGFMTDWQPNWAVLMTQASGESIIIERVFENRFSYVGELKKLGAQINFIEIPIKNPESYFFFNFDPQKIYQQAIRIIGPQTLHGGVLNIHDLRAGATLVIAALVAPEESIINGASILERGYENFVDKIKILGGEIRKI